MDYWEHYYLQEDPDVQELFEFEIRHWQTFAVMEDQDADEFTLEQSDLHRTYRTMFEDKMERFLDERGLSIHQFYALLKDELAETDRERSKVAEKLIKLMRQADSFVEWARSMRKAAQDQKDLYDVD